MNLFSTKPILLILSFILSAESFVSQDKINSSILFGKSFKSELDSLHKLKITEELNEFFLEIEQGELDTMKISKNSFDLSISVFSSLQNMKKESRRDTVNTFNIKLMDLYELEKNRYLVSLSYAKILDNADTEIKLIFNLVLEEGAGSMLFDIPLSYKTRYWKSMTVDLTTYYFRGKLNLERAKVFNKKNRIIADKLGLEPERFDFYLTENYKELNELMGFEYELSNVGRIRDGYGVDANSIFAIQNNEDFSHDIFHYYSGKINKRIDRNWITEEGLAYLWGNAYYTNAYGEMIEQSVLVEELKKYLVQNPKTSLLDLFEKNPKIYSHIASEAKVRSVISGLLCEEVEKKTGMVGVNKMINAGARNRMLNYKSVIEDLLDITDENFHDRVLVLLE